MPKIAKNTLVTHKQHEFNEKYATNGFNGQAAALEVYDTTDRAVAKSIASENLSKPNVQEDLKMILDRNRLSLDDLSAELGEAAHAKIEKKVSMNEKLRAIEIGMKLQNAFPASRSITGHINLSTPYRDMPIDVLQKRIEELDKINAELDQDTQT